MHDQDIARAVERIFAHSDLHAKQVLSISHAVIGVVHASRAGVAVIGVTVHARADAGSSDGGDVSSIHAV